MMNKELWYSIMEKNQHLREELKEIYTDPWFIELSLFQTNVDEYYGGRPPSGLYPRFNYPPFTII